MKTIIVLLSALFAAGCVSGYNPTYSYFQIQVANLTGDDITDLKLQVGENGRVLECAKVRRNAICNDYFGRRPYSQQTLELSWTDAAGVRHQEQSMPSVPAYYISGLALSVMLDIREDNTVKVYFKQNDPSRDDLYSMSLTM